MKFKLKPVDKSQLKSELCLSISSCASFTREARLLKGLDVIAPSSVMSKTMEPSRRNMHFEALDNASIKLSRSSLT